MHSSLSWLETPDGWRLGLHRFLPPRPCQPWPILCLHGFSQNYRTWTEGGFVQGLLAQGARVYVLDLRGHGYSRLSWQGKPGPQKPDNWEIEAYLHLDLPLALAAIRKEYPDHPVILCGHSLGGILSLAHAIRSNGEGLAAVVSLAAILFPDKALARVRWFCRAFRSLLHLAERSGLSWSRVRTDLLLGVLDHLYYGKFPILGGPSHLLPAFDKKQWLARLWHPTSTSPHVIRPLLQDAHAEPLGVVHQLMSWYADGEIELHFEPSSKKRIPLASKLPEIRLPLLCACGDEDLLATPAMNLPLMSTVESAWKRWLLLPKTNHIDIVAGKPAQSVLIAFSDLFSWLRCREIR